MANIKRRFLSRTVLMNTVEPKDKGEWERFLLDLQTSLDDIIGRLNSKQAAAPTTGTWEVGDRVWNNAPATGVYAGWVCTVAGTPGTWKPFGLIA